MHPFISTRSASFRAALLCTCLGVASCGKPAAPTAPHTTAVPAPAAATAAEPGPAPQVLTYPDEAFRKTQPSPGPERPFAPPTPKSFRLTNGLMVYLMEQPQLPLVSLDLVFDGGTSSDPAAKRGQAALCMQAITEGTKSRPLMTFSEQVADIAADISGYATREQLILSLEVLSSKFEPGFGLFADALTEPAFRDEDIARLKARVKETIKQAKGAPGRIAGRVAGSVLLGTEHPLAAVSTEATVDAISPADCVAFHQTHLKPNGATLLVVGDITEAQLRQAFDGPTLAGWKGSAPKLAKTAAPRKPSGRLFFIDVPHATQSQVMVMHAGPKRQAKDYQATSIAASIFGGSFASRLNMNLREDKGYAYGARGGFQYFRELGMFLASSSVRADATYQSLVEVMTELRGITGGKPVTAEELSREVAEATLGFPGEFQTARSALAMYSTLLYYRLPLDYYGSYVSDLKRLTAADIMRAAKSHVRPTQAVVLVVGDGNATMKVRVDGKDAPWMVDGKPVTLREALPKLAAELGKGVKVIELDRDGRPLIASDTPTASPAAPTTATAASPPAAGGR